MSAPIRWPHVTDETALLLTIHLVATAAMAGLIWFVQVVHYPLFALVGEERFAPYEQRHMSLTTWVVGPFMAIEGITALLIAAGERESLGWGLVLAGLLLLAVIHASTVFLQVPAHNRLEKGFCPATAERLVRTNWIRTLGWTARVAVAAAMIYVAS